MKLLLDEQIPRKLAQHFPDTFNIDHVQSLGWAETKNGALLKLAAEAGYDALISADKNMRYQQNESALPLCIVILHVFKLKLEDLIPLIPEALSQLESMTTPQFIEIDFRTKR